MVDEELFFSKTFIALAGALDELADAFWVLFLGVASVLLFPSVMFLTDSTMEDAFFNKLNGESPEYAEP